ncbi:hypothetical protein ABGN05_28810 [Aquibium sp. LZ166]|uniref:Tellurite resistance protein TerB n=1 Tax=Aquibium pacificus TaxID=3153579 RepID=A0ABV3SS59_9HYPH
MVSTAGSTGQAALRAPVAGEVLARFLGKDRISADDVIALRRDVFGDGLVSREEAEALFEIDSQAGGACPEWRSFLIEAVADYVVHQEAPAGYVSEHNADWLIACMSDAGHAESLMQVEVAIAVLERARSAPARLSAAALDLVARAVVESDARTVSGAEFTPGAVGKAEVDVLRRVLFAFGGKAGIGISREEAEALFDLNERIKDAVNHPEWTDLFVKAIANFVMCASGYAPPPREEALRRDAFLDGTDVNLAGFFQRMLSGGLSGVLDAYRGSNGMEGAWTERNASREKAEADAEAIDADEAAWLVDRITRDGDIHENERALLTFIGRESRSIHPSIRELIDRVA